MAIARAIVNNPAYLLADEPTGSLDTNTTEEILALLKAMRDRGITLIIVSHDPAISAFCNRTITISDGRII